VGAPSGLEARSVTLGSESCAVPGRFDDRFPTLKFAILMA
jgi:hypothetical protein